MRKVTISYARAFNVGHAGVNTWPAGMIIAAGKCSGGASSSTPDFWAHEWAVVNVIFSLHQPHSLAAAAGESISKLAVVTVNWHPAINPVISDFRGNSNRTNKVCRSAASLQSRPAKPIMRSEATVPKAEKRYRLLSSPPLGRTCRRSVVINALANIFEPFRMPPALLGNNNHADF